MQEPLMTLNRKFVGGGARPNLFEVELVFPARISRTSIAKEKG